MSHNENSYTVSGDGDSIHASLVGWYSERTSINEDLMSKEQIEARVLELYKNNDTMRSLIDKHVDAIVGSKVSLESLIDYEALNISREDAVEWSKTVESEFNNYAHSPENWISATRSMSFTELMRACAKQEIMTGEVFVAKEWYKSPLGYKTCFNVISSHRVKSPVDHQDYNQLKSRVFHGIQLDKRGAAVGYHIARSEVINRIENGIEGYFYESKSDFVPRYKQGWPVMFHVYEPFLPEYPRGISKLASILMKTKQVERFIDADLTKAILGAQAVFAVTSDETAENVANILSGIDHGEDDILGIEQGHDHGIPQHQLDKKNEWLNNYHTNKHVKLVHGGTLVHMYNGEKMEMISGHNDAKSSIDYVKSHNKAIIAGASGSYEAVTGDMSGLSFAGGQMSLGINEFSNNIKREVYIYKLAKLMFRSWLDEAMDRETSPIKELKDKDGNVVSYWQNRDRYAKCRFTGVKRIYADVVKQNRANKLALGNVTASFSDIAHGNGEDFDTIIKNRSNNAAQIVQAISDVCKDKGIEFSDEAAANVIASVIGPSGVSDLGDSAGGSEEIESNTDED